MPAGSQAHNAFAIQSGALRVGACRPCWSLPIRGLLPFSSGRSFAVRGSVPPFVHGDDDHIKGFFKNLLCLLTWHFVNVGVGKRRPWPLRPRLLWRTMPFA